MSNCPGDGARFPPLDSRMVTPETREEMVGGVRMETLPSETPHGDSHFDFSAVLETLLQPGYVGSIDMLACEDLAVLMRWLVRASTVAAVSDIFTA